MCMYVYTYMICIYYIYILFQNLSERKLKKV